LVNKIRAARDCRSCFFGGGEGELFALWEDLWYNVGMNGGQKLKIYDRKLKKKRFLIIFLIAFPLTMGGAVLWGAAIGTGQHMVVIILSATPAIIGGIVSTYSLTMFASSRRTIPLVESGQEGVGILNSVDKYKKQVIVEYTYMGQDGNEYTKSEVLMDIDKADLEVIRAFRGIPIRFRNELCKVREEELYRMITDIKSMNSSPWNTGKKIDMSSYKCTQCASGDIMMIDEVRGVCNHCEAGFIKEVVHE